MSQQLCADQQTSNNSKRSPLESTSQPEGRKRGRSPPPGHGILGTTKAARALGVAGNTLRDWGRRCLVDFVLTPGGQRRWDIGTVRTASETKDNTASFGRPSQAGPRGAIYCRVSSSKQKDDLERQVQAMQEEFPGYRVYTDVASGLNYKRKGLTRLLEHVQEGLVGEVVVAHPDRLARFGRELIEWIISRAGARLIFQDQIVDRPRGSEAELAADLLAVVHVFSCRANGKRRYKRAKHGGETGAKKCILEHKPGREEVQEIGTGCSTRSADDAVSTGTPPTYTSSTSMASTMAHGFQAHI